MTEGSLRRATASNSFRKFLRTVGIDSDDSNSRSSTLPHKSVRSESVFYSHSSEDLTDHSSMPAKSGWLSKQSRNVLRPWQDKWFVLNGSCLMQYASNDETQSPQCKVFLNNHTVREISSPDNYSDEAQKFLFEITPSADGSSQSLKSQDTLTLATRSQDERHVWVRLMKQVLYKHSGGAIFGQQLEETLKVERESDPTRTVPEIVQLCVEFLYANGLESDGLFRLPGRVRVVRTLREAFDVGGKRPSLDDVDVHTVASLLKAYLCDLPQPIIPTAHYDRVMHIITRERPLNPEAAVSALLVAINDLPPDNYNLLCFLCKFLLDVSRHSDTNRMTAANLATIFCPCIIKPEIDDPALLAGTAPNRATAVLDMIEHYKEIFSLDVSNDTGCKTTTDIQQPCVSDNVEEKPAHISLNGSLKQSLVDDLPNVEHMADTSSETLKDEDSMELQRNTVIDNRTSLLSYYSVSSQSADDDDIPDPIAVVQCDLLAKVRLLEQQLHTEKCSVDELRAQLALEREEMKRQKEMLARKLDEERAATADAVARVMELQDKLQLYSIKFGPLN